MNFILFDGESRNDLLPLTFTRSVADIRVGILTIREKWEKYLGINPQVETQEYLSAKYPLNYVEGNFMWINASLLPDEKLVTSIKALQPNQALMKEGAVLALNSGADKDVSLKVDNRFGAFIGMQEYTADVLMINKPWEIFSKNGQAIKADFELLTKGRKSQVLSKTNQSIAPENIFVEEGAKIECAILNASEGPIYIAKDAEIMEGSVIRGPFALCESATLKLSTKIYGPTTIGPHCKVGGEVNNSVIFGFSNKAHDGFLGNAVIGEWCNLGADTNNSNLKNNYGEVKLWNYNKERFVGTGLQFCGLIMGDHSKCSINTMFNTGTVVGVNANIFGSGFPRNFIPSFSWGGAAGFTTYKFNDAAAVAKLVYERRNKVFDVIEEQILAKVFEETDKYRN